MSLTARSSRKARLAGLVLVAAVALGACSHNRPIPDKYGATTEDNFTEGCEEVLTSRDGEGERLAADEARDVCQCTYDGISNPDGGIPFEDFKELNEDLETEPAPLPEDVQAIVDGCRDETLS